MKEEGGNRMGGYGSDSAGIVDGEGFGDRRISSREVGTPKEEGYGWN